MVLIHPYHAILLQLPSPPLDIPERISVAPVNTSAQPKNILRCITTHLPRCVSAELTSPTSHSATLAGASQALRGCTFSVGQMPRQYCGAGRCGPSGSSGRTAFTLSIVLEVRVVIGQCVEKGEVVVVLKSMKAETVLLRGGRGAQAHRVRKA